MPKARYGDREIEYAIEEKDGLKSHYISVERFNGVVLKGKPVSPEKADKLILKKAKWIIDKLELVRSINETDIVTGSRIPYLGRRYYVELFFNPDIEGASIEFNESKFKISTSLKQNNQQAIHEAIKKFYKGKAVEKITPRLKKLSKKLGLPYNELKFRSMEKRWGSCTDSNNIMVNIEAIKLSYTLIDYLLIHELVHTKIKNHSKEFWAELSKHVPNWKELDREMHEVRI